MALVDVRLGLMMRDFIDGIPLDLASKLLPSASKLKSSLLIHIHFHAKSRQAKYSDSRLEGKMAERKKALAGRKVSLNSLQVLIDSLSSGIRKLNYQPKGTEWSDYYTDTNYSDEAVENKAFLVKEFIKKMAPDSLWDFGGNTGLFSRISSNEGIPTVSFDMDAAAVEKNYQRCVSSQEKNLLPLVLDLTNPSPAIGWRSCERESLIQRGPVAMAMALALIHHLAISNNVPFKNLARFFSDICHCLIIEFVPKSDSQVKRLLASREDIFRDYSKEGFERAFADFFATLDSQPVKGSERVLYLMKRRTS